MYFKPVILILSRKSGNCVRVAVAKGQIGLDIVNRGHVKHIRTGHMQHRSAFGGVFYFFEL